MKRKKVPDEIIKEALERYLNEKLELIEKKRKKMDKHSFSLHFMKKMNILIKKEKCMRNKLSPPNRISNIACFAAMILIFFMLTIAAKEDAINFLNKTRANIHEIIQENYTSTGEVIRVYKSPKIIPEEFNVINEKCMILRYTIEYSDGKYGYIAFEQLVIKSDYLNYISQNKSAVKVEINNSPGVFYKESTYKTYVWNDKNYVFKLTGNISEEELKKTAESVGNAKYKINELYPQGN